MGDVFFFQSDDKFCVSMATVLTLSSHLPALCRVFSRAGPVLKKKSFSLMWLVVRRGNREHSTSTGASFSFYLRPCQHQHRSASSLTPLPFMSPVYMRAPLRFCRPFLPFPFMKDTCSRLRVSEVGLSGMEFLLPNARWYLEAALSSRCCPVRARPRPSDSRCTRAQPHSRKWTDF